MKANSRITVRAVIFLLLGSGICHLWGQDSVTGPSILHIQKSVTTAQTGFPQYLYMYHLLDGAKSTAEAKSLTGQISLENHSPNFSEVLWLLAYWQV